jgi:hypothetical protein
MSNGPLLDFKGHLTPLGVSAFRDAPAGRAPQEVASHIAGCAACQDQLLVTGAPGPRPQPGSKPRAVAPSPARTIILVLITLGVIAAALLSLKQLVTPPP